MSQAKVSCLGLVVVLAMSCSVFGAKGNRSYVSGNYFLTLDGVKGGFLKSVDGGGTFAEVINEPAGPSYFIKKHIGQPKYEAFEVQVGFSMTKKVYEWIAQSWSMAHPRVNGSIVALDYQLNPKSEQQFTNAILTETTIPAMDGASKEPSYLTLKFAPEVIRSGKPSGKAADFGEYGKNEQKVWLPSNFKLQIDGLDCSKVNRIEPFTVKQAVTADDLGSARDARKEPGKLEFPNLKVTLAEVAAQSWTDWYESFVIKGNNDEKSEKSGSLTLLSPNGKDELIQIRFYNMGIFRMQPDKAETNADQIKRVHVEMYVERMEFRYLNKVTGSAAPGSQSVGPETVLATAQRTE
jgi:hypothetical protein